MKNAKQLKQLVKNEADNLKKFATECEIRELRIEYLEPINTNQCIYGLMTGNCFSERAVELLNKCTIPYSEGLGASFYKTVDKSFGNSLLRAFSPIEFYISQPNSKNKKLIAYLKGETETLDL